ncbi:Nif3-like dinuclear metal center hexameric protein [Staphylococcus aureus]
MIIRKLIQHDINLIAMHTNLDVNPYGVNMHVGQGDGILKNISRIRITNKMYTIKIQTYIP